MEFLLPTMTCLLCVLSNNLFYIHNFEWIELWRGYCRLEGGNSCDIESIFCQPAKNMIQCEDLPFQIFYLYTIICSIEGWKFSIVSNNMATIQKFQTFSVKRRPGVESKRKCNLQIVAYTTMGATGHCYTPVLLLRTLGQVLFPK